MLSRVFFLISTLVSQFCIAEQNNLCNENILHAISEKIGAQNLTYRNQENDYSSSLISGVCKVWPSNASKIIVAIAYYDQGHVQDPENFYDEKHFILAVVNIDNNMIQSSYQWVDSSDIGENSLSIDTARYDLANGVRAFGLDISEQYHPHSVNGGLGPYRTLFVQQGQIIKPVLKDFLLSQWEYVVEGMVSTWPDGDKSIMNTSYMIGLSRSITNGFRDLVITESINYDFDVDFKQNANTPKNESKLYRTLHFNGKEYR